MKGFVLRTINVYLVSRLLVIKKAKMLSKHWEYEEFPVALNGSFVCVSRERWIGDHIYAAFSLKKEATIFAKVQKKKWVSKLCKKV